MAHTPRNSRTDSASRIIKASPQKIFQAFVDPRAANRGCRRKA